MSKEPKISVILPVFNAEAYLQEAIESILNQTFTDFECIIINDGSTDSSLEIIASYAEKDKRIVVISRENKGLIASLNEGISIAKGEYIARMDADDISLPERLSTQINFLDSNKNIGLVSCNFRYFQNNEEWRYTWPFFFEKDLEIKALMPFHSPIVHAAVLIRKSLLPTKPYNTNYAHAEDYKLWVDLANKTTFYNIPKVLYKVRQHNSKVSVLHNPIQTQNSLKIVAEYLKDSNFKHFDSVLHAALMTQFFVANRIDIKSLISYINMISTHFNQKANYAVGNWLKAIFIVNNTKIPFLFFFYLLFREPKVLGQMSFVQILSLCKRSLKL
jgi:glycosyltransferase involved in cell wall biosynthesis